MDWRAWHGAYADPGSELSSRLRAVRAEIRRWLDAAPPGAEIVSVCAGDGRDLAGALRPGERVAATLVELDPALAAAARAALPGARVLTADAGAAATYADVPRADLLLLCGVLGNVSDADAERTVATLPRLMNAGGRVIWTRTRAAPDLTPAIRAWLTEAGFEERAFVTGEGEWSVGVADLMAAHPLPPERTIFSFVR